MTFFENGHIAHIEKFNRKCLRVVSASYNVRQQALEAAFGVGVLGKEAFTAGKAP